MRGSKTAGFCIRSRGAGFCAQIAAIRKSDAENCNIEAPAQYDGHRGGRRTERAASTTSSVFSAPNRVSASERAL
jgi:hypothetical protein